MTKKQLEELLLKDLEKVAKSKPRKKAKKPIKKKPKPKPKAKPKLKPKARQKPKKTAKKQTEEVPNPQLELTGGYISGQSVRKDFYAAFENGYKVFIKHNEGIIPFSLLDGIAFEALYTEVEEYYIDKAIELGFDSPNLQIGYAESRKKNIYLFDFDDVLFNTVEFSTEFKDEDPELYKKISKNLNQKIKRTFVSYGIEPGADSKKSNARTSPEKSGRKKAGNNKPKRNKN